LLRPFPRLSRWLGDLSLRHAVALALLIGMAVPLALTVSWHLRERQATLYAQLQADHQRLTEVLAIAMQTPIWEVRPDIGAPLLEALLADGRISRVEVRAPMLPEFLAQVLPERQRGELLVREASVLRDDEVIGTVLLEMSTASLAEALRREWLEVLTSATLQLALGLLIVFPLLRFKVLEPVSRLVAQTRHLAAGALQQPLDCRRHDELGALGQAFEETRQSLARLFQRLEARNRELQARESQLGSQAAVLQATLDSMSDGISVVDRELRLRLWNDRFASITGIPAHQLEDGRPLDAVLGAFLTSRGYDAPVLHAIIDELRASFRPGAPSVTRYLTREGREVEIRRQPMPDGGFVSTYTDVTEELAARRRLNDALRLLAMVMDAVPASIHVKDRQLRYRMVNQRFLEQWELSRERVLGHTARELFDAGEDTETHDRQVLESRTRLPFYDTDQANHRFWTTKIPLLDANGEVDYILTVDIDVSERLRAERERVRWLQLFRDAVESIPNGFAIFDAEQRLLVCNSAYAELHGASPADLANVTAGELLARSLPRFRRLNRACGPVAGDRQAILAAFWEIGEPLEVELDDGRWMLMSRHPTAEGGIAFVRTDITDLKRMQQALGESEERFRGIAEGHPVPVVIARTEDGRILYASPATRILLGRPLSAIVGSCVADHLVADDAPAICASYRNQQRLDNHEVALRRGDGSELPVALTLRRIVYEGEQAMVIGIVDLSERKAAEQQISEQREALHQSEKLNALGTLLAGVAHELNNPLSVVVGQALMLQEWVDDPTIRQRAERIGNAADRCSRIVKTFLAMARQSTPNRAAVNLNEVVAGALELTSYALRSADIQVRLQLDPQLPPVWGNADQLVQVLVNLIVNAEQAMARQPLPRRLSITTAAATEQGVRLVVADNGPGIDPRLRLRIFEPFFTTKAVGMGTGVGLAVSHGIIRAHQGQIRVDGEPGEGASFQIVLPRCEQTPATPDSAAPGPEGGHCCRVLVVDDEPEVAAMVSDILSLDGHRVKTVGSGNQALAYLEEQSVDLILSDIRMPDLDGPGLYQRLQQAHPALARRTAFITGDALGPAAKGFLRERGVTVLEKPFTPGELRELVERLLEVAVS